MDLNPDTAHSWRTTSLSSSRTARCAGSPTNHSTSVFTSNFLEHLADKAALGRVLDEAGRCLRPGGRVIALGPNIKYLHGRYWDFWDHYVPITEASLTEALVTRRFAVNVCVGRFLPYTMVNGAHYPLFFLRAYLRMPFAWRLFGKQFLVVATRQ